MGTMLQWFHRPKPKLGRAAKRLSTNRVTKLVGIFLLLFLAAQVLSGEQITLAVIVGHLRQVASAMLSTLLIAALVSVSRGDGANGDD